VFRGLFASIHGNISTAFAIIALPVAGSVGAVVDYSRAYEQHTVAQEALERTARIANRLAIVGPAEEVAARAAELYRVNLGGRLDGLAPVSVAVSGDSVTLSTRLSVPTYFLGLFGMDEIDFDMSARSVASDLAYEVALVLDNSGSMAGSRIAALKKAAGNLTSRLFAATARSALPDPVKIAVVPFAASVNVGPHNAYAAWLDSGARSPRHLADFEAGTTATDGNRLSLFKELQGVAWAGCVEARPAPYDSDDAAPDEKTPATLFVPMFAPDEPDLPGFDNSCIADSSANCDGADRRATTEIRAAAAQARLCKYKGSGELPVGHNNGTVVGPNLNCTSKALMPLSTSRIDILSKIGALGANGMTNIHAGIIWGWRALSPTPPFTEGRAYDARDNRKILIVMTDGENTYDSQSNFNKSTYGAFGYVAKGYLGATSAENAAVVERMNVKTAEACGNVKAAGILVYTVAFQVSDPATLDLLRNCASATEMAYRSNSNGDLIATFQAIAADISTLRLPE
jgi:Flp pilus assembly protein TadG